MNIKLEIKFQGEDILFTQTVEKGGAAGGAGPGPTVAHNSLPSTFAEARRIHGSGPRNNQPLGSGGPRDDQPIGSVHRQGPGGGAGLDENPVGGGPRDDQPIGSITIIGPFINIAPDRKAVKEKSND